MYPNDDPERLWQFLSSIELSQFQRQLALVRGRFRGPLHEDGSENVREFERFVLNRLFVNLERMRGGGRTRNSNERGESARPFISRRRDFFVHQVELISRLRGARHVRILLALLLSFRESAWKAAYMSTITSSFGGGGLDNLFVNQTRYREVGVLGHEVRFRQGVLGLAHTPNEETPDPHDYIQDAHIPGTQILLAYTARTAYAAQRVEQAIEHYAAEDGEPWSASFDQAPIECQNLLVAVAFAAEFGMGFDSWYRRLPGIVQGLGIRTLVDYMREHGKSVSDLHELMNFPGPRRRAPFPFRGVTRVASAQYVAIAATALRELYDNY